MLADAGPARRVKVMGLEFPNALGLAAGLDKNGEYIDALAAMGFGFIEIGTVTPRPQPGNPKPRMFRLPEAQALINRLGFNNQGVEHLLANVGARAFRGVLGINIGKNFDTPIERAADDYASACAKVYAHASYVAVNVSSPNTKDLRQLQGADELGALAGKLKTEQQRLARRARALRAARAQDRAGPGRLRSSRRSPRACSSTSWTASSPPTPRCRARR